MGAMMGAFVSAALGSLLVMLASVALAQQVTVERDSELRAEARHDAPVVAKVKPGTTGEVTARSGPWLNVTTPEGSGWIFSFNVRFASGKPAESSAAGAGSVLGRLAAPNRPPSVTATIGIRGIEEEDLKKARFDGEQMKLLDRYATTGEQAAEAARRRGLSAEKVPLLEEVPK
jgi:hypothetical protein